MKIRSLYTVIACVAVGSVSGAPTNVQVPKNTPDAQQFLDSILADTSIPVPDSVDWRKAAGRVSSVKYQDRCVSSWAFAVAEVLEGQEAVQAKKANWSHEDLVDLSVQNVLDCSSKSQGCDSGKVHYGLEQVVNQGGIQSEADYPYLASNGTCRFDKFRSVISPNGYAFLPVGDEQILKEVVAKFGPVAVSMDASELMFMKKDTVVYYKEDCSTEPDQLFHGALVVGYGTDAAAGDYWITKHAWGVSFGEEGYAKVARNRNNNCGIATMAVIPTFAKSA